MALYDQYPVFLTNSLSGNKERLEPLHPGRVGMYVCGPTVYNNAHLGNARTFMTFDVIARYLRFLGYTVRYVRNITDVGHLESDADEGEDKIAKKARLEQLEPMEIVKQYTEDFHAVMRDFNILPPSIEPSATGHILEQIQITEQLIKKGLAYEVNGSVYFDVKKYNQQHHYGILSGRKIEELMESGRELDSQDEKRNKIDFALWKKALPAHIMRWPSPWGEGFPGWHIECTVVSTKYLGETFDIHGGGMDLLFPHHESEIAQSTICNGHVPARYWIHNNMITINGKKMGKSYNNVIRLTELFTGNHPMLEQAYNPMTIRFFILQTHYRSTLDFSNEALKASDKGLKRLWEAYETLQNLSTENTGASADKELETKVLKLVSEFEEFMNDDFSTAKVLANMFELVPVINGIKDKHIAADALNAATIETLRLQMKIYLEDIFGLKSETTADDGKLDGVLKVLMSLRMEAKSRKDYLTSDKIRKALASLGVMLKDEKDGSMSYSLA